MLLLLGILNARFVSGRNMNQSSQTHPDVFKVEEQALEQLCDNNRSNAEPGLLARE